MRILPTDDLIFGVWWVNDQGMEGKEAVLCKLGTVKYLLNIFSWFIPKVKIVYITQIEGVDIYKRAKKVGNNKKRLTQSVHRAIVIKVLMTMPKTVGAIKRNE